MSPGIWNVLFIKHFKPFIIYNSPVIHVRIQHLVNLIAPKHLHQPGDMVIVWMGEYHEVDRPVPIGKCLSQLKAYTLQAGPAIDEDMLARWTGDEDGMFTIYPKFARLSWLLVCTP